MSESCKSSSAKFNPETVLRWCNKFFTSLEIVRQKERDILIEKQMKRKWFASKTREDAIRYLKDDGTFLPEYNTIDWIGAESESSIKALEALSRAALNASDDRAVSVSSGDCEILKRWGALEA